MPAERSPILTPPRPPATARRRTPWRLLAPVGLIGLAALAVVLAAPHWLDHARVARDLEAGIAAATGLAVRVDGASRLRLWPGPALEIGPIHLTGAVPMVDAVARSAAEVAAATGAGSAANDNAGGATAVRASITAARVRLDLAVLPLLARRIEVRGAQLDALRIDWDDADGDFALGLSTPRLDLGPVGRAPDALTGAISAEVRVTGRAPELAGALTLGGAFRLDPATGALWLSPLLLTGRDLAIGAGRGIPLELRAEVAFDADSGALALGDLVLKSAGLRITGTAEVGSGPEGPYVQGQARIAPFDLRDWLGRHGFGPGRGAADRLRRVEAEFRFDARAGVAGPRLAIQDGRLRCDETNAGFAARVAWPTGDGGPAAGRRAWPLGVVALELDRLDLDPYLSAAGRPAPASGPAPSRTAGAAAPPVPAPAAVATPQPPTLPAPSADAAALTLLATAGVLRVGGLRLGEVDARAVAAAPLLRLRLTAGDLYTGRLDLDLTTTVAAPTAGRDATLGPAVGPAPAGAATGTVWALQATALGAALGPLLADLVGGGPPLTGNADVRVELGSRGDDPDALARHLGGRIDLTVRDGALTGLDLDRLIGSAAGLVAGSASGAGAAGGTRFTTLTASATGADGRFRSDDIAARSARLALAGSGDVDVPTQRLALALNVTLLRPADGSGIRELEGVAIPVQVSGPWAAPRWQVDSRAALDAAARRLLDGRAGDRLDELEQQLGIPGLRQGVEQGLQRGLRSLFGR